MKIAFYIPILNVGGAEKVIINLLKQLSLTTENKYFLITDSVNSAWIKEVDEKVEILHVSSRENIASRLKGIITQVRKNNVELVVSHLTHSNVHCLLLKLFFSFKLIVVEHNITSKYISDMKSLGRLLKVLVKYLFRKADEIICVSQATKDDLVSSFQLLEGKCKVIYNPFDFELIRKLSNESIPESILHKISNRRFIVTVARLEIQKNHLFLIDILGDYLKENNLVLVLVGGGSQRAEIQKSIINNELQGYVFITDYESNPYPYIKKSAALIHPARFEGFGLVLIESLFLCRPTISMNFQAAFEILEDGKLGYIVEDKKTLLTALDGVLKDHTSEAFSNYSSYIFDKYNLNTISSSYSNSFQLITNKIDCI
jgi:glycosyltransferase involved in cell wall biosynthesis